MTLLLALLAPFSVTVTVSLEKCFYYLASRHVAFKNSANRVPTARRNKVPTAPTERKQR
jgi:hypothetical protein